MIGFKEGFYGGTADVTCASDDQDVHGIGEERRYKKLL